LYLARERALRFQKDVLRKLLRYGGAALHIGTGAPVDDDRTRNADRVDTEMVVEPAVFRGEYGGGHIGRQIRDRRVTAHEIAAMTQHLAVRRNDRDRRRLADIIETGCIGQVQAVPEEQSAEEDEAPEAQHQSAIGDAAEKRARLLRAIALLARHDAPGRGHAAP